MFSKNIFSHIIPSRVTVCSLSDNMEELNICSSDANEKFTKAVSLFSESVFKKVYASAEEKNLIISPLSVIFALTLVSNGATGETLREFELLNSGISTSEMNEYLSDLTKKLTATDESKINIANSLWTNRNLFNLSESFKELSEKYYNAQSQSIFFDDSTCDIINKWICHKTGGMIEKTIDKIDPATAMILINTVLFDGCWKKKYTENDILNLPFHNSDGTIHEAEFMCSRENTYFELRNGEGFRKSYADGYEFIALLPKEGVDIDSFINSLDHKEIVSRSDFSGKVIARIPRFQYESEILLNDVLSSIGLKKAFTTEAELQGLGVSVYGDSQIGKVFQKAKIQNNKEGTKASAATVISVMTMSFRPDNIIHEITLDRPFVYMIIDSETSLPIFIGTVNSLSDK